MSNRFEQFLNPDAAPKSGNRFEQFVEDKDKDDELIPSLDINASMYDRFETMEEGEEYYNELIFSDDVALPNGQTAQDIIDGGGDPTQGQYRFVYTDPNTGKRETILTPDRNMFGFGSKPTVGFQQTLQAGTEEAVGDAVEFGAALSDKYLGTEFLPTVKEATVDVDTPSFGDALIADGIPALTAALAPGTLAYKGVGYAVKGLENASRLGKWVASAVKSTAAAITGEAAATATVGTDEGNFIFGEDSFFKNVAELGDTEADQLIEHRLNTFTEGLIAGGVLSTGLKLGKTGVSLTNDLMIAPFIRLFTGESGVEKAVYEQLSRELAKLDTTVDEGALREARLRITEIIRENKDILIADFSNLAENKVLNLDTVSALSKGVDDPSIIGNAEKIRAGEINSGGGEIIKERLDAPANAVREGLEIEKAQLADGADEFSVLQDSSQGFVDIAKSQVDESAGGLAAARTEFENAATSSLKGMEDDLGFIGALERLETATGTEIVAPKTGAFKEIVTGLEDSYALMVNQKNNLYGAIRGGEVDADSIYDIFIRMPEEDITAAARNFSKSDPVASFLEQLKAQKVPEEITDAKGNVKTVNRLETPDEIEARFKDWISQNTDFGFFYTRIRPELSQLASDAFNKPGGSGLGRYYRQMIKFIDEDMVKHVEDTDPDLAVAATEAKDYYMKTFAPIWRDNDSMQQFSNIYDSTLGRTPANAIESTVNRTEPFRPGFDAKAEEFTKGILNSGNMARTVNLATALTDVGDPSKIADYFILDTVNQFANSVKTAGIDGADYSKFSQNLMRYAEQLNELAGTSPQMASKVNSINEFIRRLEAAGGDQAKVQNILDSAQKASAGLMQEVENSVLRNFFDKGKTPSISKLLDSAQIKGTSNPQAAFETVFGAGQKLGGESRNRVSELMSIIAEQPEANRPILMKGLKTAYANFLDNRMFAVTKETGGTRPVKVKDIEEGVSGRSSILDIGDMIYADQPQFMQAIRTTIEAASDNAQSMRATPIKGQSATSFNREAATATTRLIYTVVGPLSRAGSRIRAVMGAVIEKSDPDTRAAAIRTELLANSNYFLELADKYNKNPRDPLLEDLMINYLSTAIVKASSSADDPEEDSMLEGMQDTLKNISEVPLSIVQ